MKWLGVTLVALMICAFFWPGKIFLEAGENETGTEQIQYEMVPVRYPIVWQFPDLMEITVVDDSDTPMEGATVTVTAGLLTLSGISSTTGQLHLEAAYTRQYHTNAQGKVEVPFDELATKYDFTTLHIEVSHVTTPPWTLFYRVDNTSYYTFVREIPIPAKMTAVLSSKIKTLESRVFDEQGNGIEGVNVAALMPVENNPVFANENPFQQGINRKTDTEGRFQLGPVREDFEWDQVVKMTFTHDNYETLVMEKAHIKKMDDPIVLKAKPLFSGRVVDENNRPIAGAKVFTLVAPPNRTSVTTDEDGRFTLRYSSNEKVPFCVTAPGKQSQGIPLPPEKSEDLLEIKMQPGTPIRIRAVDETGETVPGVEVLPVFYISYDTAFLEWGVPRNHMVGHIPIPGELLDNGTWEWCDAAREEYYFRVECRDPQGKMAHVCEQDYYRFRPREEPYVITMKKTTEKIPPYPSWGFTSKIVIRVLDYDTGMPCSGTKVTLNMTRRPDSLTANAAFPIVRNKDYFTDEKGEVALDFSRVLSTGPNQTSFQFQRDGYHGKTLRWSHGENVISHPNPAAGTSVRMMAVPRRTNERQIGLPIPGMLEISLVKTNDKPEE